MLRNCPFLGTTVCPPPNSCTSLSSDLLIASELALHLGMEAREHQGHVFVVSDGKCDVMAGGGADGGDAEGKKLAAG